jgi:hypothetical protein
MATATMSGEGCPRRRQQALAGAGRRGVGSVAKIRGWRRLLLDLDSSRPGEWRSTLGVGIKLASIRREVEITQGWR